MKKFKRIFNEVVTWNKKKAFLEGNSNLSSVNRTNFERAVKHFVLFFALFDMLIFNVIEIWICRTFPVRTTGHDRYQNDLTKQICKALVQFIVNCYIWSYRVIPEYDFIGFKLEIIKSIWMPKSSALQYIRSFFTPSPKKKIELSIETEMQVTPQKNKSAPPRYSNFLS